MFVAPVLSAAPYGDENEDKNVATPAAGPSPAAASASPGSREVVSFSPTSPPPLISRMSFIAKDPVAVGVPGRAEGGRCSTPPPSARSDVGIHVYDLTGGKLVAPLERLVGGPCEGVLHSSVVVFGNEYFFEGGISSSRKGKTRFGPSFTYTYVGKTAVDQVTFETWIRQEEQQRFLLAHYNPVRHNCHHFTLAACDYLCPEIVVEDATAKGQAQSCSSSSSTSHEPTTSSGQVARGRPAAVSRRPTFLLENVKILCETDIGTLLSPLLERITGGIQFVLAQSHKKHDESRLFKAEILEKAASMAGVASVPPTLVVAFLPPEDRLSEVRAAVSQLSNLIPPHASYQATAADKLDLYYVASTVDSSTASQNEFHVSCFMTLAEVVLEQSPLHQWAPVLRTIRLASAHRSTLLHAVHSTKLLTALNRVTMEAHAAPRPVLLEAMRLMCSFALVTQGASLMAEPRFFRAYLRLAGYCMVQKDAGGELVDAACGLVMNLAISLVFAGRGSVDADVGKLSQQSKTNHPAFQLLSVALYGLTAAPAAVLLSVNAMHFLLLAVLHIATSGPHCQLMFESHPIKMDYDTMLARTKNDECRGVICILSAVEDLLEV